MKPIAAALLACLIASPALAGDYTREEILLMKKATTAVHNSLRDPASGRFGLMSVYHSRGDVVCGEINAKNGYGGYAGPNMFLYVAKTGQVMFMIDPTRSNNENMQMANLMGNYCQ
jgi:hypothetical protein